MNDELKDSVYIVMPAYNEEDTIENVIMQWYSVLDEKHENSRLVVADSGSSDMTHSILLRLQTRLDKLVILSDTAKQHGPKVYALYDYSIKNCIDYVFQTDSDGQTCVNEFDSFWEKRKDYSGVFGYRKNREDGKSR